MSNLGDNLQDTINALKGLSLGDNWRSQFESFIDDTQQQLNAAAPEGHDNSSHSTNFASASGLSSHADDAVAHHDPATKADAGHDHTDGTINPAVTNTGELSVTLDGSPAVTEQVVYKTNDTDATAPLSVDTEALPDADKYRIDGGIDGRGDASFSPIKITINNDTTNNYRYNYIKTGNTGLATTPHWVEEMFNSWGANVSWSIGPNGSTGFGPFITSSTASHSQGQKLLGGERLSANNGIDSIQISTDFNAVATFVFTGVTY